MNEEASVKTAVLNTLSSPHAGFYARFDNSPWKSIASQGSEHIDMEFYEEATRWPDSRAWLAEDSHATSSRGALGCFDGMQWATLVSAYIP